jgi:methylenetetrahydrofolate dehydrogenase (NADP+)/methenyltetrahydrofolate cyclohydrolase
MTATLLDGRQLAKKLRNELSAEVAAFTEEYGVVPTIAVVRAGEDPASVSYGGAIEKAFAKQGMGFALHTLPETASQGEIVDLAAVKGALSPDKDIDGVHPVNTGRLTQAAPIGRPAMVGPFFVPATPAGGLEILKQYEIELQGKHAVVVGRSNIVGKPMAMLLLRENATVTMCHSRTADLAAVCRSADILCAAVGRARMIRGDWVKPGAIVIDFGVNFVDGQMCGDVDFEAVKEVAGLITPVPGGTGPMTNVMLMRNVIAAARRTVAG